MQSRTAAFCKFGFILAFLFPEFSHAEWQLVQEHAAWEPRAFHTLREDTKNTDVYLGVGGGLAPVTSHFLINEFWWGHLSDASNDWVWDREYFPVYQNQEDSIYAYSKWLYWDWDLDSPGYFGQVFVGGECFERGCTVGSSAWAGGHSEDFPYWHGGITQPYSPRVGFGAVLRDKRQDEGDPQWFIVIGGLEPGTLLDDPNPRPRKYLNDVWGLEGQFTAPWAGRYGHTCVFVGDTLVLTGGYVEDDGPQGERAVNDVWTSNDDGETWSLATAAAPWVGRGFHAFASVDGRLFVAGGRDENGQDFNDTWYSDDLGQTWGLVGRPAGWAPRHGLAMANVGGDVWMCGGRTSQGEYFNDVWRLDATLAPAQSIDRDGDLHLSIDELMRLIQFYNSPGYHCEAGTEDGYAPGPGAQDCAPLTNDYAPADWSISLDELLRAIQFYNSPAGYTPCLEGEDGFCPVFSAR